MRILKSPFKRTERLRFSLDGGMLIGSGIGMTKLTPPKLTRAMMVWNLKDDDDFFCLMGKKGITRFQTLNDGKRVQVDTKYDGLWIFDLDTRKGEPVLLRGNNLLERICSPDGVHLTQLLSPRITLNQARHYFVSAPIQKNYSKPQNWTRELDVGWGVRCLEYTPDGRSVIFLRSRRNQRVIETQFERWSAETGETIESGPLELPEARRLFVSPDQTRLAFLTGQHIVCGQLDNLATGTITLNNDNASHFSDIAFHPSSRLLAAASNDHSVKFYETDSWTLLSTFTWNSGKMRSIAFSPDGTVAAAGSSTGQVVLWDVDF